MGLMIEFKRVSEKSEEMTYAIMDWGYFCINYLHRMLWGKSRINELETCLAEMAQFYIHVHTPLLFPLPAHVLSKHSIHTLTCDYWSKGAEMEKIHPYYFEW